MVRVVCGLQASKQPGYVPGPQRPEGRFVPALLDEFLEILDQVCVCVLCSCVATCLCVCTHACV